jgi:hypothetical protein
MSKERALQRSRVESVAENACLKRPHKVNLVRTGAGRLLEEHEIAGIAPIKPCIGRDFVRCGIGDLVRMKDIKGVKVGSRKPA